MPIDRRQFVAAVGAACVPWSAAQAGAGSKPYGSGYFGEWIEDEFGLPAFRYTCDQTHDPKAVTQVSSPGIISSTEHIHQVGNDRLIAIVSNYGHVRVRQDEGAPKYLNAYSPERSQYGGGIGYLTDGNENLSTFYPGGAHSFDRIFGAGYFRKKVAAANYSIDQSIIAPFGDDPVLLSQVTIANHGPSRANLRWIEYWGCQDYQFSFRVEYRTVGGGGSVVELRRKFGDRFTHRFAPLEANEACSRASNSLGRDPQEEQVFERMKAALATRPNPFLAPIQEPAPGAAFDDLNPPATFLVSLDAPADGFTTDAKAFFGAGGVAQPSGLARALDGSLRSQRSRERFIPGTPFSLAPGEQRTLYFLIWLPSARSRGRTLVDQQISHSRGNGLGRTPASQWKELGYALRS